VNTSEGNDSSNNSEISLDVLVARIWHKRSWLFVFVGVCSLAFVAYAMLSIPIYRATVVMVSAGSERSAGGLLGSALNQIGNLASFAGLNAGPVDLETEESLAVLRSREFTIGFIKENNLMPLLFSSKWDSKNIRWKDGLESTPTDATAYQYFDEHVRSIVQDKKTGLISLRIDWIDREQAAIWANKLIEQLNTEMRNRSIAKAGVSIEYLNKELVNTLDIGTRDAINRLIEAQVKQRMLANVTKEYVFRIVDRATAPDKSDILRPNRTRLIFIGPIVGFVFGVSFLFLIASVRESRRF
jgi:LPS O-antigen subunit length determinant protein (WzzB/FepE family)